MEPHKKIRKMRKQIRKLKKSLITCIINNNVMSQRLNDLNFDILELKDIIGKK